MTEKQIREFTTPKYVLIDMTDRKHPVDIATISGFENAKAARENYKATRPNTKVYLYRINEQAL